MKLVELRNAITELSGRERGERMAWFLDMDREAWDRQIEKGFSPGGASAKILEEVDAANKHGDFKPLE